MLARRNVILYGSLALTLIAVALVGPDESSDVVQVANTQNHNATTARATIMPQSGGIGENPSESRHERYGQSKNNLFHIRQLNNVPTNEQSPTQQSEPDTAFMPFEYIGQQHSANNVFLFLLYKERTLALREGDVVDNVYRIGKITPQSVEIVYLPLKQSQFLDFGSAQQ